MLPKKRKQRCDTIHLKSEIIDLYSRKFNRNIFFNKDLKCRHSAVPCPWTLTSASKAFQMVNFQASYKTRTLKDFVKYARFLCVWCLFMTNWCGCVLIAVGANYERNSIYFSGIIQLGKGTNKCATHGKVKYKLYMKPITMALSSALSEPRSQEDAVIENKWNRWLFFYVF